MNISELRDRKLKLKDDIQVLIETFIAETGVYPVIEIDSLEIERMGPGGPEKIPIVRSHCVL